MPGGTNKKFENIIGNKIQRLFKDSLRILRKSPMISHHYDFMAWVSIHFSIRGQFSKILKRNFHRSVKVLPKR